MPCGAVACMPRIGALSIERHSILGKCEKPGRKPGFSIYVLDAPWCPVTTESDRFSKVGSERHEECSGRAWRQIVVSVGAYDVALVEEVGGVKLNFQMIVDAVLQRRVDGRKGWKLDEIAFGLQRREKLRVIDDSHA